MSEKPLKSTLKHLKMQYQFDENCFGRSLRAFSKLCSHGNELAQKYTPHLHEGIALH